MYGQLRFAALEIVDPQALLRNKLASAPGAGQTALLLLPVRSHARPAPGTVPRPYSVVTFSSQGISISKAEPEINLPNSITIR